MDAAAASPAPQTQAAASIPMRRRLGPTAVRVLALTAAAWLQGVACAQGHWDPFASPDFVHGTDPVEAASAPSRLSSPASATTPGPVDATTISRMLGEAEAAYAAGHWAQAMEAFKAVTAFDAGNAQAWLRIGNLHHRRTNLLAAASAYRKAAGPAPTRAQSGPGGRHRAGPGVKGDAATAGRGASAGQDVAATDELRTKALVNLASVNLELALAALDEAQSVIDASDAVPAPLRQAHRDAMAEAAALGRRIDTDALDRGTRVGSRSGAQTGSGGSARVSPTSRTLPMPAPTSSPPASAPARPNLPSPRVPPVPEPDAARPVIEYLRGAPQP